jgi:hypothetical protein
MGGGPEVNREDFCELRDTERTNRDREALQQAMGVSPVRLIDVP